MCAFLQGSPCAVSMCSSVHGIPAEGMFYIKCTSSQVRFLPCLSLSQKAASSLQSQSPWLSAVGLEMERGVRGGAGLGGSTGHPWARMPG